MTLLACPLRTRLAAEAFTDAAELQKLAKSTLGPVGKDSGVLSAVDV